MVILTMKMFLSVVLKDLIIVYFRLTFYFPLIAVFTRHVLYVIISLAKSSVLLWNWPTFIMMLLVEAKAPAPKKLRGKTWKEVLTFYNAVLMPFYSYFPQKFDWDSFNRDWNRFEYQLGWFCYTQLATQVTTMWASLYLYISIYIFFFSKATEQMKDLSQVLHVRKHFYNIINYK